MFDLIITNAMVVDGSGGKPFKGHVGLQGERVTALSNAENDSDNLESAEAAVRIDAAGRMLTPGFVDVHGHSDMNVLANANAESKLRQGITTEIVGNCGYSAFPLRGQFLADEQESNKDIGLEINWQNVDGYLNALAAVKPAMNIASFVGHCNIRGSVMGFEDRQPTSDEMKAMRREVEIAMEAGALGLSTGLIYSPGFFADSAEVVELQKAAGKGIYASHVRGEGDTLLEAADEFMEVVEGAGCQGQFSHLKASAPRNWGKVSKVIEQVEAINERGGNVRFDKYPYVASSTGLDSLLPRWVRDGGRDRALERLADSSLTDRIISEAAEMNEGKDGWDSVIICSAGSDAYKPYHGKSIGEIAVARGMKTGEVFIDMLLKGRMHTSIANFTMNQEETDLVLTHPLGMVCTDAGCRAPYGALHHDFPHPRAYGSFGKFFRDYVKERSLMSIEAAVAKVSALPCETFGLRNRGKIAEGYFADLLLIDWPRFEDRATFGDPHQYCTGLDAIVVNGCLTVSGEQHTGNRGGRFLRREG